MAFEAIVLANKYRGRLRPLLRRVGGKDDLLTRVGKLLGGTHPASGFLARARNGLGFHWDYEDEFIGSIVDDFTTNEKIVWVEEVPPPDGDTVHRFSAEVLAHALLPEVAAHSDPAHQQKVSNAVFGDVVDAINVLAEYFAEAVVAYLRELGTTATHRKDQ